MLCEVRVLTLRFDEFGSQGCVYLVYTGTICGLDAGRPLMSLLLQLTLTLNMFMLLGLNVLLSLCPHMTDHSLCLSLSLSYHVLSLLASLMDNKLSLGLDLGRMFFGLGR